MLLLNVLIFLNSAMLMLIFNAYMCLKLFLGMSFKAKKVTLLYNYNSAFQRKKKHYFLQMIDRSRNHLYTSSYTLQKNIYIYILCHHFTLIDFHFFFGISIIHVVSLYYWHIKHPHLHWQINYRLTCATSDLCMWNERKILLHFYSWK